MRLNRMIDDRAHRLAARRVDGRMVAARLMAAECERMLAHAGGALAGWLREQGFARQAGTAAGTLAGTLAEQADAMSAFVLAGRLGWDGPWRALVGERLEVVLARRDDGVFFPASQADQAAMARALTLGGRALDRDDLAAMAVDLRARMARDGRAQDDGQGALAGHAQAVVVGMARWRRLGEVVDVRSVLTGAAGLMAGREGAMSGADLWCLTRGAAALLGEDRLWLCP